MYRYEIFQELCEKNKLKPADVSRNTGVSTATLSSWKKGKYQPKSDKIAKLADYFDVPVSYFETGLIEEPVTASFNMEKMIIESYLEAIGYKTERMFSEDGEHLDDYDMNVNGTHIKVSEEVFSDFANEIHRYCLSFISASLANEKGTMPPKEKSDLSVNDIVLVKAYNNVDRSIQVAIDKLLDIQKVDSAESKIG